MKLTSEPVSERTKLLLAIEWHADNWKVVNYACSVDKLVTWYVKLVMGISSSITKRETGGH